MRQRNYNKDPTDGGTIVTFDDGQEGDAGIDIEGNIYEIKNWRDISNTYGPNSFDVIFMDGGLNKGSGFADFRAVSNVKEEVKKRVDEIVAKLLKPTGKFMRVGGGPPTIWRRGAKFAPFKSPPECISDPFGRGVDDSNVWKIVPFWKKMLELFTMEEVEEALAINDDEEAAIVALLMGPVGLRRGAWRNVDEDELDAELANLDEEGTDDIPEWLKPKKGGLRRRKSYN